MKRSTPWPRTSSAGDVDAQERQGSLPLSKDACSPANPARTVGAALGQLQLQFLRPVIACEPGGGLHALEWRVGAKAGRQPIAILQAFIGTTAGLAKRLAGEQDSTVVVEHRDQEAGALHQLEPRHGWHASGRGHVDWWSMPSI